MTYEQDIETIIVATHALTRIAAAETGNPAPSAQWRTLSLLRETGPVRLGELAALSRVTQPGMTRLVGQMADAGLIERSADATDSRASVISITDAGVEAVAAWRTQLTEALAPKFADLDDAERDALRVAASVLARKTRVMEVAR